MKNQPLFSIIIATFNSEKTLEKSILSVINQTYRNIELIIIDGGSKDSTLKIIEKYKDKVKFYLSEQDKGVYDAWNKALPHCEGDWIYFLGSDDYFYDINTLKEVTSLIFSNNQSYVEIVYGKVVGIKDKVPFKTYNSSWGVTKNNFFKYGNIHHQGVFHSKNIFKDNKKFDVNFKYAADYELILRSIMAVNPCFIDMNIAYFSVSGMSCSIQNSKKIFLEYRKAQIKNGVYKLSFRWTILYLYSALKLIFYRVKNMSNVVRI